MAPIRGASLWRNFSNLINGSMQSNQFLKELERSSGMKLKLKVNDNRSTMLSVRWEPDCTKVSLHRIFLQAPQNVMELLACYLRREDKIIAPKVKSFIEDSIKKLDYTHKIDHRKLCTQGMVYDLQEIYDEINEEYFNGKVKLFITWYGKKSHSNRSRVTFGLYYDPLKLVKISRFLDSEAFPDYVVSYVVYHEMLHHVCPAYIDENGLNRIHSKEFKIREKDFRDFEKAQKWIREHHKNFFHRGHYGRS